MIKRFVYARCEGEQMSHMYVIIDMANDKIISWATRSKDAQEATEALNKVEDTYNEDKYRM